MWNAICNQMLLLSFCFASVHGALYNRRIVCVIHTARIHGTSAFSVDFLVRIIYVSFFLRFDFYRAIMQSNVQWIHHRHNTHARLLTLASHKWNELKIGKWKKMEWKLNAVIQALTLNNTYWDRIMAKS